MNTTLTISSQGQVVIPVAVRKLLGAKAGDKLRLRVEKKMDKPVAVIEPVPKRWVDRLYGAARGIYGDVDKYIQRERDNWK